MPLIAESTRIRLFTATGGRAQIGEGVYFDFFEETHRIKITLSMHMRLHIGDKVVLRSAFPLPRHARKHIGKITLIDYGEIATFTPGRAKNVCVVRVKPCDPPPQSEEVAKEVVSE